MEKKALFTKKELEQWMLKSFNVLQEEVKKNPNLTTKEAVNIIVRLVPNKKPK